MLAGLNPTGGLRTAQLDRQGNLLVAHSALSMGADAAGRTRGSTLTTLFDGKSLNGDNALLWATAGTGTLAYTANRASMFVAPGQYLVRQSRRHMPYYSGKSQLIEATFFNFAPRAGITKRVGYFSDGAVAPYTANLDGFYLESTEAGVRFVIVRDGTIKVSLELADWEGYDLVRNYDWDNFTIALFDFLWLGGATVRFGIHLGGQFISICSYTHAGNDTDTLILSPNQPVRYEIRSTTGTDTLYAVCSQVSTEGSREESGRPLSLYTPAAGISCNVVGTIYALIGVKLSASFHDNVAEITRMGALMTTANDQGLLVLVVKPTLSAPLVYAANSGIQVATGTGQTLTAGTGRIIEAFPVASSGNFNTLGQSYLNYLSADVAGVPDEVVLAYVPASNTQTVIGTLGLKEH